MTDSIIGFILGLIVLFFMVFSFTGCQMIESTNTVRYENGDPVQEAQVHQWNDNMDYTTYTNENGSWTLVVPLNGMFELCVQNPMNNYVEACYDGMLIVDANGTLI